jgi:hypothetical protein
MKRFSSCWLLAANWRVGLFGFWIGLMRVSGAERTRTSDAGLGIFLRFLLLMLRVGFSTVALSLMSMRLLKDHEQMDQYFSEPL